MVGEVGGPAAVGEGLLGDGVAEQYDLRSHFSRILRFLISKRGKEKEYATTDSERNT